MAIVDVELSAEAQSRYLTYALSVVSSRALPDVRDGLKPVQRRILYAMLNNLGLLPDKGFRKSAAVVGEVLARFHPHGDSACYEAMVRMAQDFSLRYPLVEGQGNFGSLDGDAAAAYRYTEARLTSLALEVLGDIHQNTVMERDNFDQTMKEPVVLPARLPNLLINGATGIAVGMATSIPPHNLTDTAKALMLMIEDPDVSETKLINAIKAPDFPTKCQILNSKDELREIYTTGRGAIRMRSNYLLEDEKKGKQRIVVTSIPYGIDKSVLVSKIADLIIQKKISLLTDIRDESTTDVRIVIELTAGAEVEKVMAFLYKNTTLQSQFNVNLTALVPTANPFVTKPELLSLKQILSYFLEFRVEVVALKLQFERSILAARLHLLEGLQSIMDRLNKVIELVRASDGRSDAANKLQKHFTLSDLQALYIVDLRIYQLSKTSIDEIISEIEIKRSRITEIDFILSNRKNLLIQVGTEIKRIVKDFGDERYCEIVSEYEEVEFTKEEFIEHEQVNVIVTRDGWVKRIRNSNDPAGTRIREGDAISFVGEADTRDLFVVISNQGNLFATKVLELAATSGFGDPIQKIFKFNDSEQITKSFVFSNTALEKTFELALLTTQGLGMRLPSALISLTKKGGKKLVRLSIDDTLIGVEHINGVWGIALSEQGYSVRMKLEEFPLLNGPGRGVIIQRISEDDKVIGLGVANKGDEFLVKLKGGGERVFKLEEFPTAKRANKGDRVVKRGQVESLIIADKKIQ